MKGRGFLVVLGIFALVSLSGVAPAVTAGETESVSVTVTPFENTSGDPALARWGDLAARWIKLGLEGMDLLTVTEEGGRLEVSGRFTPEEGGVRFEVGIRDREDGNRLIPLKPVACSSDNPCRGIDGLREEVMGALAVKSDPWLATTDLASPLPLYSAYLEYRKGAEVFSKFDYRTSIIHLKKAMELDPKFPGSIFQIYWAYSNLGMREESNETFAKLIALAPTMGESDFLYLKLIQNMYLSDNEGTAEAMRRIVDKRGYKTNGYMMGLQARRANYPREAVKAFEQQRLDTPWAKNWMPAWYWQTSLALHMTGDYGKELEIGRRYAADYPTYLAAYFIQGRALVAMGKTPEAEELIDRVLGDKKIGGVRADFTRNMGLEILAAGRVDLARKNFQRSMDLYKSMNPEERKNHRSNISYTYYLLGDWEEAEAVTRELAKEFPDSIAYKGNLGAIAARKGNIEEARRVFRMLGEVTAAWNMPQAKFRQSLIAALLGEKDTAVRLIKEVLDTGWDYGPGWLVNPDYESLRDFAPFVKLFAPKG